MQSAFVYTSLGLGRCVYGCLFFWEVFMIQLFDYFSVLEKVLWSASVLMIILSFLLFDRNNFLILAASLIGVTSLIFCAKGNAVGQMLMIIFSLIYGYISFSFEYYGEMITYLGMTLPMAVVSLVSWIRNPYKENKTEVKVNTLKYKEIIMLCFITAFVTLVFHFILAYFHTANLLPSTLSVMTSFIAAYLTFRRSPYFAIAYAANDCVLIILWVLASLEDSTYISVVICFIAFLFNDLYGFYNWRKMKKRQSLT